MEKEELLKNLTGYPSKDMPWLKYYREGALERANNIPRNKTAWDVIEEKLIEYYDVPAIEYFKTQISRPDFIDLVYTWARTFRAMGVETNEVVPVYGPFFPDICAMTFALNTIGACPYFLKLAISPQALAEETQGAKVAVVYDGMWKNVAHEFSKDKFKKVIVATASDAMPSPKKEIVSFLSYVKSKKAKSLIPKDDKKYVWIDDAKSIANYYTGEVRVPFEPYRSAFITSSSGTTIGGVVKGCIATNESTIAQLYQGDETATLYMAGGRCLNNFPPTASTSLNALFMFPLYRGMTVLNAPKVSEKDFYDQVVNLRPNVIISTGSFWNAFFNQISKDLASGKKHDFSYAKAWVMGGEGADCRKYKEWNELLKKCNSEYPLLSGYGLSELFSVVTTDIAHALKDKEINNNPINVGIPYAGINVGVYDNNGNELKYNERGELYVDSITQMKGYYLKPEYTKKTIVDGKVHTGDIASINENGFVCIYGRKSDLLGKNGNEDIYLFDISNKLKEDPNIADAMLIKKEISGNSNINLVAHIVWDPSVREEDKDELLKTIDLRLREWLPLNIKVLGYKEHQIMLPYSPTTLKIDRKRMDSQLDGYKTIFNDNIYSVSFKTNNDGKFDVFYDIINKDTKVKKLAK